MKVVILEDDKAIRTMLTKICAGVLSDHEIVAFTDGTEAEEYILSNSSAITHLICDQNHPGMLGEEIISELRNIDNLTTIIETADEHAAKSVREHFPDVLTLLKPYSREKLTKLLQSVAN